MNSLNIGIAGAGISGLVAGIEIQRAGHAVSIFESRSRTGGRIQSLQVNGLVVETGPEFIHGKLKETIALLRKYKIFFEPVNGKMYTVRNGRLSEFEEMAPGWDKLFQKMKSLESDLPFMEFLNSYFPGDDFIELRKTAVRFAEGFDLADVHTASTQALILEWEHDEEEQYHIPAGYESLIRALENEFTRMGGKIFLNHQIESIEWDPEIRINIKGNQVFLVDKLIVTLPLSVLNPEAPVKESIIFYPALREKQEAFKQIGFGTVTKIVMIWHSEFWKALAPDAQFILSDGFFPTWWTQYPSHVPMLTGWLGGSRALEFAGQPDSFFFDKAVESLVSIFSLSADEIKNNLKDYRIFNWKNEPGSRGAYSYSRVGFRNSKTIYRKPVQNRLYFAGEASYDGPHPGTVEAAVVSGLVTAENLIKELS
jgi:monoamine oxidase